MMGMLSWNNSDRSIRVILYKHLFYYFITALQCPALKVIKANQYTVVEWIFGADKSFNNLHLSTCYMYIAGHL